MAKDYVYYGGALKLINYNTVGGLPIAPSSLKHEWTFVQGADAQLIYDKLSSSNGVRGATSGAEASDFSWNTGGYATFDGGDYGTAPSVFAGGNASFTIAALVKNGSGNRKAVTFGAGAGQQAVGISSNDNDYIQFVTYGGDTTTTALYGTDWRLVFFGYDGVTRSLTGYAGATQIHQSTLGGNLAIPANPTFNFGKPVWTLGEFWNGSIADVLFYNAKLTAAEIASETTRIAGGFRPLGIESNDFPAASGQPVAFSSLALQQSIGVGIHANYTGSAYYDSANSLARTKAKILDLGVKRVRDGMKASPQASQIQFFKDLVAAGIKVTMVAGDTIGRDGQFAVAQAAAWVTSLKTVGATSYGGIVDTLEGPNEWDATGRAARVQEWIDFYNTFRTALRAESSLSAIPFYGGSMANAANFDTYLNTNQEGATMHPYPGGEIPETPVIISHLGKARASAGVGKPVIATEATYNNATATTGGNVGVPELIDGHYTLREFVWNLLNGISQTHKYQLIDDVYDTTGANYTTNIEQSFGTLAVQGTGASTTWTLREKPVYAAMKRLIAYLSDNGTGALATRVNVTVSGKNVDSVVVPVARKDGSYYLMIWQKNSLWSTATRANITDTTTPITLTFPSAVSVTSYRPSVSATITTLGSSVTNVTVPADGKLTIIRVG